MVPTHNIPKRLTTAPFSIAQAEEHGISRYQLYRLVKKGVLERLERGIFRIPAMDIDEEDSFRAATLTVGPTSAICLLSALSYYNLTEEIPHQTWVMVEQNKRASQKSLKLIRTAHPKWNIDVEQHAGYRITSIERTLIECLIGHRFLGKMLGIESLKKALLQKKTTLNKIISTASRLGNINKIQKILEILS